jgi:hypothetical protein
MTGDNTMGVPDMPSTTAESTRVPIGHLPVHPVAELLPMMSDDEIRELADDIKVNGMQQPVIVFVDNAKAVHGDLGPFPRYILDGRNRLAALKLLGIDDPEDAPIRGFMNHDGKRLPGYADDYAVDSGRVRILPAMQQTHDGCTGKTTWEPATNPATFALSLNVRRRHLDSKQKRAAIAAYIEADPEASDRKVAKAIGVSPTTVGKARGGDQNVQGGQNDHRPIERAKTKLRELQAAKRDYYNRNIAKAIGVSAATVARARKELAGVPTDNVINLATKKTPAKKAAPAKVSTGRGKRQTPTHVRTVVIGDFYMDVKRWHAADLAPEARVTLQRVASEIKRILAEPVKLEGNIHV